MAYRELARLRPDAFLSDLARSLAVLGVAIREERAGDAMASFAEAIGILTPFFLGLPQAHGGLMAAICKNYLEAAKAAGLEPDFALLGPVVEIFQRIKGATGE